MNDRKKILIIIGGVALAVLLILTNMQTPTNESDVTPASQKKPEQTAPALLDSFI